MVLIAGLAAALAADDPMVLAPRTEVLDNGLTVVLLEDQRTDTVALHIVYGVGARDEREGELGCAHLFEHLMFEGSANAPGNAFDTWLTAGGGQNNAWTSDDETAYHMTFPSGALDLALFLESDRLGFLDAGLDQANLDNQQQVVLQERAQGYAEPSGRDWDALGRLTHAVGHPYHNPVIGTVADIEGFQLDAVRGFWATHYRPRNAVLVLVGNFSTDAALERVVHWLSDVPDAGATAPRDSDPVPSGVVGALGMIEDDVEERTLYLSWESVPRFHDDEPVFDLLTAILSGGRGTRIDDALYHKRSLASDVGAWSALGEIAGRWLVYAASPDTPLPTLKKHVLKHIARIAKKPPSADEMLRARRSIKGGVLDRLEDPLDKAEILADCYRLTGNADCLASDWARYERVTPEDVSRVARDYLATIEPSALSVVPRGDDGALEGSAVVELP